MRAVRPEDIHCKCLTCSRDKKHKKLDKKKRPPRVEANIEGSNVKDNELPLSRLFGVHFTLWQKFSESRGHESKSVERIVQ